MKKNEKKTSSRITQFRQEFNEGYLNMVNWFNNDKHIKLMLFLLVAFQIYFSLTYLGNLSLRLDESQSLYVSGKGTVRILNIIAEDVHVPLYLILLKGWQSFFQLTPLDVVYNRIFSLIFQLISIPVFYQLTKSIFKKKGVAIFSSTLVAISPILFWYANELRMYSLLVLVTILSHFTFRNFEQDVNKVKKWMQYTFVSIIGIYTHYFYLLVLLSQFVYSIFYKDKFKAKGIARLIQSYILLAILLFPWVFFVISQGSAGNTKPLLLTPNSVDVFNTLTNIFFGFQSDYINTIIVSFWPVMTICGIFLINFKKAASQTTRYFLINAFLPILIAFIVSVIYRPVFLSRYLIIVVPSFYILLTNFAYSIKKTPGYIFRVMVILLMATSLLVQTFNPKTPIKENYREVSTYLNKNATDQDIVSLSAPFTLYPIQYYYSSNAKLVTIPEWELETEGSIPEFNQETFEKQIKTYSENYNNIYVVLSYDQGYEDDIKNYLDSNFALTEQKEFSNKLNLYKYRLRY
jgi:mannosyltransferase